MVTFVYLKAKTRTNRYKKLLEVNKYTEIKLFAGVSMNYQKGRGKPGN